MTLVLTLAALGASSRDGSHHTDGRRAVQDSVAIDAERALVQRVRSGDGSAFKALMEVHFAPAVRFAAGFLREHAAAEDVAQDVFTKIWLGRETWFPAVSVRAYVLGAVRHRALNVLKHRGVETRYTESAAGIDDAQVEAEIIHTLDNAVEVVALRRAIDALPDRRRVALTLRYEMGLSHAEIGDALGVSAKAVKELLARTLEALHGQLHSLR